MAKLIIHYSDHKERARARVVAPAKCRIPVLHHADRQEDSAAVGFQKECYTSRSRNDCVARIDS